MSETARSKTGTDEGTQPKMIEPNCRKLRHGVAAGAAVVLIATTIRMAAAQTSPPPERVLQIELDSPPGVVVRIRPYLGNEAPAQFLTCPPSCKLAGYAGLYQIEADPPSDSPLRRLRKTVKILDDSRVFVEPGERADHHWGGGVARHRPAEGVRGSRAAQNAFAHVAGQRIIAAAV